MDDKVRIMRERPLDYPREIVEYAEKTAQTARRFASYLELVGDDVMQRYFGFRRAAKKGLLITEVMRRITGSKTYLWKNMYYTRMGGYVPVYEPKDVRCGAYGYVVFGHYDFDLWYDCDDDLMKLENQIVNLDVLERSDRWRHCGYNGGCCFMDYLNAYAEDNRIEFFGKAGIEPKKSLMRKAEQDGRFRRFLRDNAYEVATLGARAAIYAYDHGMTIPAARNYLYNMRYLGARISDRCGAILKRIKVSPLKVAEYLKTQADVVLDLASSYGDYLTAIEHLGYDMSDTKNLFPRDFPRMHDLRLQEYDAVKVKEDAKKRRKLYADFRRVAVDAKRLEWSDGRYTVVIPGEVYDLVREGRALHHCVGDRGYDLKVAEGKSLIAFVRRAEDPGEPYVTVEYGLGKTPAGDQLLQYHGRDNVIPDEETMEFINAWFKKAKKIRKEMVV